MVDLRILSLGAGVQSTTLALIANNQNNTLDTHTGIHTINEHNNIVISRPNSNLWTFELYNFDTGALLLDSNGDQPQKWWVEIIFTKLET